MFLKILFRNFRDCFVVQLSKFIATRLKQLVYSIKSEEVCQQLFSFIFKFLFDLTDSVLFRVVLADSLYMISSLPASVNTFFQFFDIFLMFSPEQSVRLTHTLARERIAQLYIPLRELRFLARSAFLCNGEFQRNFLLHNKKTPSTAHDSSSSAADSVFYLLPLTGK